MIAGDILARIEADFGAAGAQSARSRLERFDEQFRVGYGAAPNDRVVRCIVHLARGNGGALAVAIRTALTDWRDVIYQAEYECGDKLVRDLSRPFTDGTSKPEA